jgi:hypothetical protein
LATNTLPLGSTPTPRGALPAGMLTEVTVGGVEAIDVIFESVFEPLFDT